MKKKWRSIKMNLKRVKRMVPIQVGERTAYEVDRDGKWLIRWPLLKFLVSLGKLPVSKLVDVNLFDF